MGMVHHPVMKVTPFCYFKCGGLDEKLVSR